MKKVRVATFLMTIFLVVSAGVFAKEPGQRLVQELEIPRNVGGYVQ